VRCWRVPIPSLRVERWRRDRGKCLISGEEFCGGLVILRGGNSQSANRRHGHCNCDRGTHARTVARPHFVT
jgi:hypothetical protein